MLQLVGYILAWAGGVSLAMSAISTMVSACKENWQATLKSAYVVMGSAVALGIASWIFS